MWRRWNNNNREPVIGQPMLFETTVDENYLETIPEVESIQSRPVSVVAQGLPELPLYANLVHPAIVSADIPEVEPCHL